MERTTDTDTIYDVCIVGAGLTGSAAARWITSLQKDIKVCLIGPNEPREHEWCDSSRTIFGAHYDQGRIVSVAGASSRHESWLVLTQRSILSYKQLGKESGKYYMKVGHGLDLNQPLYTHDDVMAWYRKRGDISNFVKENLVSRLFTSLKDFQPKSLKAMTCVITSTPTGRIYCDMATPRLGVITGANGSGAYIADEVGRMGALMIIKGAWDHDLPAELFRLRYRGDKGGRTTISKL